MFTIVEHVSESIGKQAPETQDPLPPFFFLVFDNYMLWLYIAWVTCRQQGLYDWYTGKVNHTSARI